MQIFITENDHSETFDYQQAIKQCRKQVDRKIADFVLLHPEIKLKDAAKLFSISLDCLRYIAMREGVRRRPGRRAIFRIQNLAEKLASLVDSFGTSVIGEEDKAVLRRLGDRLNVGPTLPAEEVK